jgi:peptidoglycan/xylan/chitin deacetylase (PgdA/CDA1 family)
LAGGAAASYWLIGGVASRPGRRLARKHVVARVRTRQPHIALTFDDGPDPVYTQLVVDALGAGGAAATFFVLGANARLHPHIVRHSLSAGHEIASHGFAHDRLTRLTPRRTVGDLRAASTAIVDATAGVAPRFYRPPHGLFNLAAWHAAPRLGMERALWSRSARDWAVGETPDSVARRVLDGVGAGEVVLLHDAGGFDGRAAVTADALPLILAGLRRKGLIPVTLSQLVDRA